MSATQKAKMMHDYKHCFLILRNMVAQGENDKLIKYLDVMVGECLQAEQVKYTGNESIDVILEQKKQVAQRLNIDVAYDCNLVDNDR